MGDRRLRPSVLNFTNDGPEGAFAVALVVAAVQAASLNTRELRDAMQEAEDTDSALDWMHKQLKGWAPDAKKIMKGIPPLEIKDDGIDLQGARDLMGVLSSSPGSRAATSSSSSPRLR